MKQQNGWERLFWYFVSGFVLFLVGRLFVVEASKVSSDAASLMDWLFMSAEVVGVLVLGGVALYLFRRNK
jgi:uncharacterized membrane protein YhhN